MATFSTVFNLNKTQSELDFVDIDLDADIPLYVDPYALTTRDDDWSIYCHQLVVSFFEAVLQAVRTNDDAHGFRLLSHLNEPEETHLGVSKGGKGRGIGAIQAKELFQALSRSSAAKTGLLEDLSDFALFIPNIGRDKISDMTTNIIRAALIEYTRNQCALFNITTRKVPSGFFWDMEKNNWHQDYVDLPIHNNQPILLIPKYTVRWEVGVDHTTFRRMFVLEYLRGEHLRADDSLVTAVKNNKGKVIKRVVLKKTLDEHYPTDKEFLAQFSAQHRDVVDRYRDSLKLASSSIPRVGPDVITEKGLALHLAEQLKAIPSGAKSANDYHSLMIGIVSFIFFPNLIYPKKEKEINEGRKRIDITYTNGKDTGIFYRLALDQSIKANIIHVECKNYTADIANPEFDQLLGRFDTQRGKMGILLYRRSENQFNVISRCRDASTSGQGLILPLDDEFVIFSLNSIAAGARYKIDEAINALYLQILS